MIRKLVQRLKRIRCWLRYYHVYGPYPSWAYFRYDVDGMCYDCGKVGTGVTPKDIGE